MSGGYSGQVGLGPPGGPEPPGEDARDRSRRRGRRLLAAVLGLAVLAGAWVGVAHLQRDRVVVEWAGPLRCTGAEPVRVRIEDRPVLAMRQAPGVRCTRGVRVRNDGWFPVRMDQVTLPFMGPGGGGAMQVRRLGSARPEPGEDRIDGVFARDVTLRPTQEDRFAVRFDFRADGCSGRGTITWVRDLPAVQVRALGLPGTRSPDEPAVFRGTRASEGC